MKKNYIEYTLSIDGMMCGMCEAHVNNIIWKNYPNVKKVKSNHHKGKTVIFTEEPIDLEDLKEKISSTGYRVSDIVTK